MHSHLHWVDCRRPQAGSAGDAGLILIGQEAAGKENTVVLIGPGSAGEHGIVLIGGCLQAGGINKGLILEGFYPGQAETTELD